METNENSNYVINSYHTFDDMNLKDELLRGIYSYGFEKPSSIQQRAIIPMAEGHDIIGQAQSGTGKTATFTIGTLQLLSGQKKNRSFDTFSNQRIIRSNFKSSKKYKWIYGY